MIIFFLLKFLLVAAPSLGHFHPTPGVGRREGGDNKIYMTEMASTTTSYIAPVWVNLLQDNQEVTGYFYNGSNCDPRRLETHSVFRTVEISCRSEGPESNSHNIISETLHQTPLQWLWSSHYNKYKNQVLQSVGL